MLVGEGRVGDRREPPALQPVHCGGVDSNCLLRCDTGTILWRREERGQEGRGRKRGGKRGEEEGGGKKEGEKDKKGEGGGGGGGEEGEEREEGKGRTVLSTCIAAGEQYIGERHML